MNEYRNLAVQLRICADSEQSCEGCPYFNKPSCVDLLLRKAADVIEKTTYGKEEIKQRKARRVIRIEDAINTDPYLYMPYVERSDLEVEHLKGSWYEA